MKVSVPKLELAGLEPGVPRHKKARGLAVAGVFSVF
jgi:hypothetical protein